MWAKAKGIVRQEPGPLPKLCPSVPLAVVEEKAQHGTWDLDTLDVE